MRARLLLTVFPVALALAALAPDAAACDPAVPCEPLSLHLRSVPANATTLPLGSNRQTSNVVLLRGQTVVAAAVETGGAEPMLVPEAPLTPGSYTIRHATCHSSTTEEKFDVVPAVTAPTATGTLVVERRWVTGRQTNSCLGAMPDTFVADVILLPAADLLPHGAVARLRVGTNVLLAGISEKTHVTSISVACSGARSGGYPNEGAQHIEVSAQVLGSSNWLPPAALDFDLRCPEEGSPERGPSVEGTDGGCAVSPASRGANGLAFGIALALAALVLSRRRASTA